MAGKSEKNEWPKPSANFTWIPEKTATDDCSHVDISHRLRYKPHRNAPGVSQVFAHSLYCISPRSCSPPQLRTWASWRGGRGLIVEIYWKTLVRSDLSLTMCTPTRTVVIDHPGKLCCSGYLTVPGQSTAPASSMLSVHLALALQIHSLRLQAVT